MDDMRFKTGGFNGLAIGSVGSDKVLVIFTTALFSQFSTFSELPFFNGYNNQTKLKIKYTDQYSMRLRLSRI